MTIHLIISIFAFLLSLFALVIVLGKIGVFYDIYDFCIDAKKWVTGKDIKREW